MLKVPDADDLMLYEPRYPEDAQPLALRGHSRTGAPLGCPYATQSLDERQHRVDCAGGREAFSADERPPRLERERVPDCGTNRADRRDPPPAGRRLW